jgi:hypothetical protein
VLTKKRSAAIISCIIGTRTIEKNQFDKEKRGWDGEKGKTIFDCHGLE